MTRERFFIRQPEADIVLTIDDELLEHDCPLCDELEFEGFGVIDDDTRRDLRRFCAELSWFERLVQKHRRRLHLRGDRLNRSQAQGIRDQMRHILWSMETHRRHMRWLIAGEPAEAPSLDLWADTASI